MDRAPKSDQEQKRFGWDRALNVVSDELLKKVALAVFGLLAGGLFWLWGWFAGLSTSTSLPSGAVVAFNKACPEGWKAYEKATARFVIGAGTLENSSLRGWKRELQAGGFEEIELTSRKLEELGGEENHILTVPQLPNHAHNTYRTEEKGDGKYPNWNYMGQSAQPTNVPTQSTGGNQPHNNMPPFIALSYCEKAE